MTLLNIDELTEVPKGRRLYMYVTPSNWNAKNRCAVGCNGNCKKPCAKSNEENNPPSAGSNNIVSIRLVSWYNGCNTAFSADPSMQIRIDPSFFGTTTSG
ncbi:hypothetical protein PGB90_001176 [Kerria lacca]